MTSYQFLAMLSKINKIRGAKHGLSERQRMFCKAEEMLQKLVNPSMEEIIPYLKDGTKTNNTESLCQNLGGQRSKILLKMTRLPRRTTHTSQQDLKEFTIQNI